MTTESTYVKRHIRDLPRACGFCGRNDKKVVVRDQQGLHRGYCASCWNDEGRYTPYCHAIEHGREVVADNRKRIPAHRPKVIGPVVREENR